MNITASFEMDLSVKSEIEVSILCLCRLYFDIKVPQYRIMCLASEILPYEEKGRLVYIDDCDVVRDYGEATVEKLAVLNTIHQLLNSLSNFHK